MNKGLLGLGIIGVMSTGCGSSISTPASQAKGLASIAYDYHASSPDRAEHLKGVSEKITFDTIEFTHKKQVDDKEDCGYGKCQKLEDESTCYVKYSTGDDWGIITSMTYSCKGEDKDDEKKAVLKRAKASVASMASSKTTVITETEYNSQHVAGLAQSVLSVSAENGKEFNIGKCINDYIGTMSDVAIEHAAWGCDTEWTGESLVERVGFVKSIEQVDKKLADLDCSTGEDYEKEACKKSKANLDNRKDMLSKTQDWVKGLEGDNAKLYAYQNFGTASSCQDKALLSDGNFAENMFVSGAFESCTGYSIGSGMARKDSSHGIGDHGHTNTPPSRRSKKPTELKAMPKRSLRSKRARRGR